MSLPEHIKEYIPKDNKDNLESFLYKWTNLVTDWVYIGKHKGEPLDDYWNSSTSDLFREDIQLRGHEFKYEILMYGNENDILDEETKMLKLEKEKGTKLYNKTTGAMSKQQAPRISMINDIADDVFGNRAWANIKPVTEDIDNLTDWFLQSRGMALISSNVKDISRKIDKNHGVAKDMMITVLLNREYKGETGDLQIDGNNTKAGVKKSKHGKFVDVLKVPKEVHQHLTDTEVFLLSGLLNKRDEIRREEHDLDSIAKAVVECYESGQDKNSQSIKDLLDAHRLYGAEKRRVKKLADDLWQKSSSYVHTNWIDYSVGNDKVTLDNIISTENKEKGVYAKALCTSKIDFWPHLFNVINHNDHFTKEKSKQYHTVKFILWHKNAQKEKEHFSQYHTKNDIVLEKLLKPHNIEVSWQFMPTTRTNK